jgi:uncharacterized protein YecE (DUF72 family)
VAGRLWVGCSGWSYVHWREPVYHRAPESQWLARYAQLFDTVEVNTSFYVFPAGGWWRAGPSTALTDSSSP